MIDLAVRNGTMSAEESAKFMARYKQSLGGYTYLLWESPNNGFSVEPSNIAPPTTKIPSAA
jgi:hypothetical protein